MAKCDNEQHCPSVVLCVGVASEVLRGFRSESVRVAPRSGVGGRETRKGEGKRIDRSFREDTTANGTRVSGVNGHDDRQLGRSWSEAEYSPQKVRECFRLLCEGSVSMCAMV